MSIIVETEEEYRQRRPEAPHPIFPDVADRVAAGAYIIGQMIACGPEIARSPIGDPAYHGHFSADELARIAAEMSDPNRPEPVTRLIASYDADGNCTYRVDDE